ncbi:N-acetylmuramoyl-L-alanine amidase [Frigidibacter sp. MR17.24]|uniref:N-acetylmuramoyl-L-alanine amidase n=1 Tax=Frigidibacter sp. MR17.24 TaxID=3127345 RepID=UPI003012A8DD
MTAGFPSPNHGERRGGLVPSHVVIHYTAMESHAAARARLCDPAAEVSCHWLIGTDGRVEALVDERRRAWHAGAGSWGGLSDLNSRSIGIELDNRGERPFAARQIDALHGLLAGIRARWAIPAAGVIGHSDMAPGRKADPGPRFDWRRLGRAGLAPWPSAADDPAATAPVGGLDADLLAFGYPAEVAPDLRLAAFRLRFRPGVAGPADGRDAAIAAELARRWPAGPGAHVPGA